MSKDLNKRLYSYAMFDGHLRFNNSTYPVLIINMLEANRDYINRVAATLEEVPVGYKISEPGIYISDGYDRKQQVRLQSKSHPIFKPIMARMYNQGRKQLDPHMLTMLDAEMLAIAFMADGSRYLDKRWENAKPNYRLHLNNLSYGDLMLLKAAIKEKLNIEINARKKGNNFDLAVPTAQSQRFEEIVEPYILPSFQYKLGR